MKWVLLINSFRYVEGADKLVPVSVNCAEDVSITQYNKTHTSEMRESIPHWELTIELLPCLTSYHQSFNHEVKLDKLQIASTLK